jgi:hypothetical protein
MRKFLIPAVLAASALTAAAPAAAQWAPPPVYGSQYGSPYGQAYGYNNYGQARRLEARVWELRRQIDRLDARNQISERQADRLRGQANDIRRELRRASYGGMNSWERNMIERRIANLEFRIRQEASYGNRWGDRRYGDRSWDRDHDGRDDRWDNNHNQWHDRRDNDQGEDDDD